MVIGKSCIAISACHTPYFIVYGLYTSCAHSPVSHRLAKDSCDGEMPGDSAREREKKDTQRRMGISTNKAFCSASWLYFAVQTKIDMFSSPNEPSMKKE
eukprot:3446453-Amphidinium_carterae.1